MRWSGMRNLSKRLISAVVLLLTAIVLFFYAWLKEPIYPMQKMKLTFLPQYKSLGLSYFSANEEFYSNVLDVLKSGQAVILTKMILLKKDDDVLSEEKQEYVLKFRLLDNKYLLLDKKIGAEVAIGSIALKREVLGTHRLWMQTSTDDFKGKYVLNVNYQVQPENKLNTILANMHTWRMRQSFTAEGTYEVLE